jgi:SpoVK/Ycf46/Vps4 family AAA+-type ATPase
MPFSPNVKSIGSGNVDQTENAIQNIILEEMENLDGILIATTNLTENLDKAFERRFLFKIRFDKPTLEAKTNIWKDKIPACRKRMPPNLPHPMTSVVVK